MYHTMHRVPLVGVTAAWMRLVRLSASLWILTPLKMALLRCVIVTPPSKNGSLSNN